MPNLTSFITGCFVGATVGGLFGVLLAPNSGSGTRKLIVDGTKDTIKKVDSDLHDIQHKAESTINDIQHKTDRVIKDLTS